MKTSGSPWKKPKRGRKFLMCKLSDLAGKTVSDLLATAFIDPNDIPRDLDQLLRGHSIIATSMDFAEIEDILSEKVQEWGTILGAVAVKNNNFGIFYRTGSTFSRIRFTVAHELAHCCLHSEALENGHVLMRYDGYFQDEEEIRADDFASELLMPERLMRAEFNMDIKPRVVDLAKKYIVSLNVMWVRLMRLGLLGAAK